MSYQNISHVMPADHANEIRNAITLITERMPFLVNLNPAERQALLKHADRDTEFVNDAIQATTNFPNVFPAVFNVDEFQRDVTLHRTVGELLVPIMSLVEKMRNTELALGNEVMKAAGQVYKQIQAAKSTTPGIQKLAEKMATRYKGQGKKKSDSTTL